MNSVAGVFVSRAEAVRGAHAVRTMGVPEKRISLLTPASTMKDVERVPVTDAEPPGIGTALGAAVGGSIGVAGGMWLGEALTTLLIPGVGPIAALGVAGAAILGALGAVGGGAAGHEMDAALSEGIPGDELFVYEDALRQGRSVVIALADDDAQANAARSALKAAGAETIDEARHQWWIGLRAAEKEKYDAAGGKFEQDEKFFRRGFEAALHINHRGQSFEESLDQLRYVYPDDFNHAAFRKGFERGQDYLQVTAKPLRSIRKSA
jgi:outer membrane lipoprotein SlyB